jgi:hypothetical protein
MVGRYIHVYPHIYGQIEAIVYVVYQLHIDIRTSACVACEDTNRNPHKTHI